MFFQALSHSEREPESESFANNYFRIAFQQQLFCLLKKTTKNKKKLNNYQR